jgi:hypothetical protein
MKREWFWLLLAVAIVAAAGGGAALTVGMFPYIRKFAEAIANAEGYSVPGSLPARYNNPGDLTVDVTGKAVGVGQHWLVQYATPEDGWDALYKQVEEMFTGQSLHYDSSMTIAQIAKIYATDWMTWANNVANYLGVTTDTTLDDIAKAG